MKWFYTIRAAKNMDWQQVIQNGGPPCFHLGEDGKFCGRAQQWEGHVKADHEFVSLEHLIKKVAES